MRAAVLVLIVASLAACGGKSVSVTDQQVGDVGLLQGDIQRVYLLPFDQSTVDLIGAHGEGEKREENLSKWFTHVAAGAQYELDKRMRGTQVVVVGAQTEYDGFVMGKMNIQLEFANSAPAGALAVTGSYIEARNVSGSARFWGGTLSGKTWTRASVVMARSGRTAYSCTIDGKQLGGGWSWGYETLAANEALGRQIVRELVELRKG